jgi:hypothetical protein
LGAFFLLRRRGKRGRMISYMLPGVGLFFAALSPGNVNAVVHTIGGLIAFVFGSATVLMSYRWFRSSSSLSVACLVLGALSIASVVIEYGGLVLYAASLVLRTHVMKVGVYRALASTLGVGGWERMIAYPIVIWLIVVGSYLVASSEPNKGLNL